MNEGPVGILREIETNTEDGAALLALRALDALEATALLLPSDTTEGSDLLEAFLRKTLELRPSMGAIGAQALLAWDRARSLVSSGESRSWRDAMQTAVAEARTQAIDADRDIAAQARIVLGTPETIATCSYSSTVMNALETLSPRRIIVGEGYPLGDGARCAREAIRRGFEAQLTSDESLPAAAAGADAVIIGADQVLDDGTVVNRSGTFPLALGAQHFQIPVFVVCHRIKLTGITRSELRLEPCPRRDGFEVSGASIYAPLFDVTPAALITKTITEIGVLTKKTTRELGRKTAHLRRKILGS